AHQASPIEAAWIAIRAIHSVEVAQLEHRIAHHPVVRDQDARDRAQRSAVEPQPGEDVDVRVSQQVPRLDHDTQNARDQATGAEADQFRDDVREVVRRAHDVGRYVYGEGGDRQGEEREDDDQRVVELCG